MLSSTRLKLLNITLILLSTCTFGNTFKIFFNYVHHIFYFISLNKIIRSKGKEYLLFLSISFFKQYCLVSCFERLVVIWLLKNDTLLSTSIGNRLNLLSLAFPFLMPAILLSLTYLKNWQSSRTIYVFVSGHWDAPVTDCKRESVEESSGRAARSPVMETPKGERRRRLGSRDGFLLDSASES